MNLAEAKERVLAMISADRAASRVSVMVDPASPDPTDAGKFVLQGKPARVIQRFSGWHPHVAPDWFAGGLSQPRIKAGEFYWYVFHLPAYGGFEREHYFICDFMQMRDWVVEFVAAHAGAHQNHSDWRAAFHRIEAGDESRAYFRWGDEPRRATPYVSRVISLDNVAVLAERQEHVGSFRVGGESEAHRLLKLHIADRPQLLGLDAKAASSIEHSFRTGDRVDVLFDNHGPRRSVVEVEIEGEDKIVIGIHQAIKYRALAAAQDGYALVDPAVRAYVVAYETAYPGASALAGKYDVRLVTVDRSDVVRCVA